MPKYDIHIIQNISATGVEFSEKKVNLSKGDLLSSAFDGTPTVLDGGSDNFVLFRDNLEVTGLKWKAFSWNYLIDKPTSFPPSTHNHDSDYAAIIHGDEAHSETYLKVEADPVFSAHTASNIVDGTGFLKNDGSGVWSYDNSTYLTSETDPVFLASEAANFVAGDKSKLDGIEDLADVTDEDNVTTILSSVAEDVVVDSDTFNFVQSVGGALKKITWSNIKGTLKTYFDTLYQTILTFGIADGNAVEIDDIDTADNDYAKFTANGLEGRSYAEVRSDLNVENGAQANAVDSVNGLTGVVVLNLDNINNVTISGITSGEIIKWNGTGWVNNTLAEADVASVSVLSSHTGNSTIHFTQGDISIPASQISDFDTEVSNNAAVTLNTAKVTNATHTGDVTGSTVLTIGADKVLDSHINWGTGTTEVNTADIPELTNLYYTEARVSANTNVSANTTHRTSTGADHTYIDQDVTNGSTPVLANTNMTGNVSVWANDSGYITGITSESIADLSDVTITILTDNELLAYNTATSEWTNQTPSEAGFATVAITGAYTDLSGTPTIPNTPAIYDNAGTPALETGITALEVRTLIDVDQSGTDNSTNVTLAGTPDYITIVGQTITRNQIDLTTDVTGVLPNTNVASNITLDNITQITNRSHTNLSDIGTNTHAQIDTHITNVTTNPHNVDKTDVGLDNVPNLDFSNASNITTGTLPSGVLPPIAITSVTVVVSEVEQLALTAQEGDVAVRSDLNKSYMHNGGTAGTMADWTELQTPTDSVLSVNGETGTVVLDADDISDAATTNKFVTATDITNLGNLSGTNTGDVTVTDSAEIDFTLVGQDITASLKTGSIDVLKLDSGVQTSLGLADSALQSVAFSDIQAGSVLLSSETFSNVDTQLMSAAAIDDLIIGKGYVSNETDPVVGAINGIVKADGAGNISAAVANTDYQSALTFGIANDNAVEIDDLDAADNDYAKFTLNGLEGRSYAEVKTDLSLNNVENTALSTWTGSGNITTVGTIGTGTWQGTAITDTYISSASTWNSKLDSSGVTYENLNTNGDVGTGASQVAVGNDSRFMDNRTPTDASVTYAKVDGSLKDRVAETGTAIDWDDGQIHTKTLTANTTFTFSNLREGKVITIILSGNYTATWPSYMDADHLISGEYDGTTENYIQVHCTNDASGSEEVWWAIKTKGA